METTSFPAFEAFLKYYERRTIISLPSKPNSLSDPLSLSAPQPIERDTTKKSSLRIRSKRAAVRSKGRRETGPILSYQHDEAQTVAKLYFPSTNIIPPPPRHHNGRGNGSRFEDDDLCSIDDSIHPDEDKASSLYPRERLSDLHHPPTIRPMKCILSRRMIYT